MTLLFVFIFLLGLTIGSFLNCLIWRLYKEETILGRSYCPSCRKRIKWHDNIPVISFLFLKGKCRYCRDKISWQYPLVELMTGILFLSAFYFNIVNEFSIFKLFFDLFLISILIIIFVFDSRWFLIPVQVLIFSAVLFAVFNLLIGGFSILELFLAVLIGAGFFALQFLITRGKGIGEGDIWLGGFLGIVFPVISHLVLLIFLTYIIGGIIAAVLIAAGLKKMGSKIPLGIFLTISSIITLFWADNIINWYFKLIF